MGDQIWGNCWNHSNEIIGVVSSCFSECVCICQYEFVCLCGYNREIASRPEASSSVKFVVCSLSPSTWVVVSALFSITSSVNMWSAGAQLCRKSSLAFFLQMTVLHPFNHSISSPAVNEEVMMPEQCLGLKLCVGLVLWQQWLGDIRTSGWS